MSELVVQDLGRGVSYPEGMEAMRRAMAAVDEQGPRLLLLEHTPVITVTRSGGERWLKHPRQVIEAAGIAVCDADRGGDVTFHGPGQLVGYPVVKLAKKADGHLDLVGYVHRLETALVSACAELGVEGLHTRAGETGVWAPGPAGEPAEKLVAIGVGVGFGGVTRHGFALNVDIELDPFCEAIVPCGLQGRGVTSLAHKLGEAPDAHRVREVVARHVAEGLGFERAEFLSSSEPARGPDLRDGAFHG